MPSISSHLPSKILYIDSRDASQYLSTDLDTGYDLTSYFKYDLVEKLECPDNQVIFVSLNSTTIPYSFYNIRDNVNDKLDMIIDEEYEADTYRNTSTKTITINAGNYSSITLGNFLATEISSTAFNVGNVGTDYTFTSTCDYDSDTQKYVFTFIPSGADAGKTLRIRFLFSTGANTGSHSNIEFGFLNNVDYSYTSNTGSFASTINTYTSINVVDINGSIHGVYIRTNLTSNSTLDSQNGTFSNILARIPIKVQSGGIIFREPNNSVHKALTQHKNISQISIRLTDERNRLLDLNGLHFQLAIQFDFDYLENVIPPQTAEQRRDYMVDAQSGAQSKQLALQNLMEQQNLKVKDKGGRPRKVGRPKKN
tara:strand:+ start:1279 stop:2379 length:1101 start_codon:yes stop_codon:yes gene_type:complete